MALASLADRVPVAPAEAARNRTAPGKVTGRLKVALDGMVWRALTRAEAAEAAGMSEHSLYAALRKPHVRAWYAGELEVLRTSERARNIHTLAEVRDQKNNQMARVQAVKALEQLDDQASPTGGQQRTAGLVVVVLQPGPSHMAHERQTAPKPLIEHDSVPHDE